MDTPASLVTITATLRPDAVEAVDAAIERLFAALDDAAPQGVRYASTRAPDGVTAVILLQLEDGTDNPLTAIPAFVEFQRQLPGWVAGPPQRVPLAVKGSYRLL